MDYIIKNIKDVSDEILDILNNMMNRNCQVGKFSLRNIRDIYSTSTDILYVLENTEPVYFLLLDVFTKHKTVYIHDVCIGKKYRGKGLFKKSLASITKYYNKKGFTSLTLDASDSTKEEGLNQKARIHIFHSAGFSINLETGYFTESGDYEIIETTVGLDDGQIVTLKSKTGKSYKAIDKDGNPLTIDISQIANCFDGDSKQISCPMIMNMTKNGGRQTRRNNHKP
jgi:hypothetical protein